MSSSPTGTRFIRAGLVVLVLLLAATAAFGQSTATVTGTVMDESGAVIPSAQVTAINQGTNLQRTTTTDATGNYQIPFLPAGTYRISVQAPSLQQQTVTDIRLDVSRTVAQNFRLKPGTVEQAVTITGEMPIVEASTMTVGQVLDPKQVQEIPLNGRHFVDLGLLVTGSVTPPAAGFLTAPIRGQGSLAINTAGARETQVNFMVNGINLADTANGQITFQPSLSTLDEFKVDNSSYSAAEGRNAGAIVNIGTRSGTNQFHGELFEYMRNNYFDARNFFNKDTAPQSQFIRHDFGADLGGPIIRDKLFFFGSYEGLRQRQGVSLNQTVLSAAQRSAALASPNPTIQKLVPLIPTATDATGTKFIGSASAPVLLDQWSGDVQWNVGQSDRIHGYYTLQRDVRTEPLDACTPAPGCATVPGYGDQRKARRQLMTFTESHTFSNAVVNEFRLGYNRIHITFDPNNNLDPSAFGISNGHTGNFGLPEFFISSIGLDFGGVQNFPQGRGDLTTVISDTVSWLRGRHSLKFGWEGRQINNDNFGHDQTFVQFANPTDFIAGRVNSYVNNGDTGNRIIARAVDAFVMDSFKLKPYFTLELGLRWEWNMTPFEAHNRQSAFVPATAQIVQVGTAALPDLYNQNSKNFEPRVGFAWDVLHNGKTVLRAGYGWAADQPLPFALTSNPPFVTSFRFTSTNAKPFTGFSTLNSDAAAGGVSLASGTVDPNFKNDYVQSYNLNIQQQITQSMGLMVGYFGSKGTHMRSRINLNQPFYTNASGAQSRPFLAVSSSSPIAPGLALGSVIDDWVSGGNSNYNALWTQLTRRFANGLQFAANYTWSKSLDYNSQDTFASSDRPSNSLNLRQDYGPSDFDARHRFTFNGVYDLPFKANLLVGGWRLGGILTLQSGNPINIIAGNPAAGAAVSSFTGRASIRPDVSGPIPVVNQIIASGPLAGLVQWIAPSIVCDPRGVCPSGAIITIPVTNVAGNNVYHFGNLSRNAVVGPNFKDVDMSLTKTTKITERLSNEFRVEVFDVFNHPNFGNPNRSAVSTAGTTFGVISSTRFPNGDSGSARQLQFALKFIF
jgi:hypothetical protein